MAAEGLDKWVTINLSHPSIFTDNGLRKYDIIAILIGVAKAAVKEKVQRVVVATLRVGYGIPTPSACILIVPLEPVEYCAQAEPPIDVHLSTTTICRVLTIA